VGAGFNVGNCAALTALNIPALTTVGDFNASGCAALADVSIPLWVPTDGTTISFSNCALSATSVEHILRRLVLAGVGACTIDLSGGTNAGTASLSLQGQADVTTLGGQLAINP
jgi:hypothetical protein